MVAKLSKKQETDSEGVDAVTKDRIEELKKSIAAMRAQIAGKEIKEQEREHSKKSHGTRFLERQRLTRMEKSVRKKKGDHSQELLQIAMDQIYVAHYPLQKPYRPLFKNKQRWLHHSVSRAQLRHTIAQDIKEKKVERVNWISEEQYARVPAEWSVTNEVDVFQYPKGGTPKDRKASTTDSRFSMSSKHETLLEAADKLESKMAKKENKKDSQNNIKNDDDDVDTEGSSDDSSDEDETDQTASKVISPAKRKRDSDSDSNDNDSDSDSSDDDEADPLQRIKKLPDKATKKQDREVQDDSDSDDTSGETSSSSSSSSSDDDDDDDDDKPHTKTNSNKKAESEPKDSEGGHSDSDDDFFVAAKESKEDDIKVFELVKEKPEHRLPAENPAKGDKSQGWATQEQRPGRYKKKRERW